MQEKKKSSPVRILLRLLPLVIVIALMVLAWAFGLDAYFSYEQLKQHREELLAFVNQHPLASPLVYMAVYAVATALSIPGGATLSIAGGFLFPQPLSTLYVVVSATIGATIIFLVAKTALGSFLRNKAAPFLKKMEEGFRRNAISYLLFLRFIPLFPFWLVNIAPAFFGVSPLVYVLTTFFGIIPGAFVYTQAGAGLGAILDAGEAFSVDTIFNLQVRIALIALAIFSLIPIVVKWILRKRNKPPS